ncbi:3-hydroxyacyl-CoA dehydrogenase NAD-binding domain-containing protein [Spongisporangium articulatum]|uniref:3-hydroxyacyl-CoA dehydrogenase NAD-binding domain-containing protein n=1 Tax=Spongisporangium articulatum TaxID=3362603 RepID=A0ABW8AKN3_9ACTN
MITWNQRENGVVVLTLDDPGASANTMSEAFVAALAATVDRLEAERDGIAGVVLTSAKKTFFAGGNLEELVRQGPDDRADVLAEVRRIAALLRRLERLGRPVVAAVNGTALGGGLELTLACHHRVVLDDDALRLGFPEVTLGLLPGAGGVVRSVRLLGLATALTELLLSGKRLRAGVALKLGLVDEVATDPEDLLAKAEKWIAENPDAAQPFDRPGYKVPGGTPSSPALAAMLPVFPATLVKQLKGAAYPAPRSIVAAAVEGLQVDVDTAFEIEHRYFVELACGQISSNMVQALWFDLNTVNSGARRPADVPQRPVTKAAVIGAGMMGGGIAHVLAEAGVPVVLKDVDAAAAQRAKDRTAAQLEREVARGRRASEGASAVLGRLTPTGDYADLAGCDLVIEAVFEDPSLKHDVFTALDGVVAPDALLASNTSTLPITGLAQSVSRPEDFIGLHFFSPVERMPLVEIIVGEKTGKVALARAYDVVRALGKTPIVVNDSRGFFTSRVFTTLVLEGAALLGEGMPPMSVERAALQVGFPAGPLTLMDEVSLSLMLAIAATEDGDVQERSGGRHPGFAVVEALAGHGGAGRRGKASGGGFFDWRPEGEGGKRVWPGLSDLYPEDPGAVPIGQAAERMLTVMAVESTRCLAEGVVLSVEDANVGSILGIGFPAMYGGALQYIEQYQGPSGRGVPAFVAHADALADAHGERFRPPRMLRELTSLRETPPS